MFVFDNFTFDNAGGEGTFQYYFEDGLAFTERVQFVCDQEYDSDVLERALFLAFILIGTSYYKTAPTSGVKFANHTIDEWQAGFLNKVYQEGLSQFAFENSLTRSELAQFMASGAAPEALEYSGEGILQLQSGGKDSLLMSTLLAEHGHEFSQLYISSGNAYPAVIDQLGEPLVLRRTIDHGTLAAAREQGGLNGHVPVTYIVLAISLVQAVLSGKQTIIASIGHEGEEPHGWVGDLPVNHQWSKTWQAEQLFAAYIDRYVTKDINIGSPVRQFSELKIAELFADKAWARFGRSFSSCNVANYGQGADNTALTWCGDCPKCANSYLLFAPFVAPEELQSLFRGRELFSAPTLIETFKGLLGIDDVMKPFECIGEVDELRWAYHRALQRGYAPLPFGVPESQFDKDYLYESQGWAAELIQ